MCETVFSEFSGLKLGENVEFRWIMKSFSIKDKFYGRNGVSERPGCGLCVREINIIPENQYVGYIELAPIHIGIRSAITSALSVKVKS